MFSKEEAPKMVTAKMLFEQICDDLRAFDTETVQNNKGKNILLNITGDMIME